MEHNRRPLVVGISGASGAVLARQFLELLLRDCALELDLIVSRAAEQVWYQELGEVAWPSSARIRRWAIDDLSAGPSSGSYPTLGMVIVPCSMGTLGRIAQGVGDNLLCRAADVTIKEHRPLLLGVRESPLSAIHLRNMLCLAELGVQIVPPMLTCYNGLEDLPTMAAEYARHLLELLGLGQRTYCWGGGGGEKAAQE